MPFLEHFVELRVRFIRSVWGLLVGFGIAYYYAERLYDFLVQPLCIAYHKDTCPVIYTSVVEPFMVYLKVGLLGGFFIALPWIFYQVWLFIQPGLKPRERKFVIPFVVSASMMFVCGASIGYFLIFPFAFDYFLQVAPAFIQPMLSMETYFSFAAGLLFAFGALFEIPLLVVLLNIVGVVSAKTLWKSWRFGIIGIFILSAILTPADPYTMLMLAIPLSILFIGSLVVCSALEKARAQNRQ